MMKMMDEDFGEGNLKTNSSASRGGIFRKGSQQGRKFSLLKPPSVSRHGTARWKEESSDETLVLEDPLAEWNLDHTDQSSSNDSIVVTKVGEEEDEDHDQRGGCSSKLSSTDDVSEAGSGWNTGDKKSLRCILDRSFTVGDQKMKGEDLNPVGTIHEVQDQDKDNPEPSYTESPHWDDVDEWKLLVPLFNTWDFDESESIDRTELLLGLARYCDHHNITFDMKEGMDLFHEVDVNDDGELDSREFSVYLRMFTDAHNVSLEEFAKFMIQDLKEEYRMEVAWKKMPKLFEAWDLNSSGQIERKELCMGLDTLAREHGIELDKQCISDIYYEVDMNSDECLDYREFGAFFARLCDAIEYDMADAAELMLSVLEEINKEQRGWEVCPKVFIMLDDDNRGDIDGKEVLASLQRFCQSKGLTWNGKAAMQIYAQADDNGDNRLDHREFAVFIFRYASSIDVHLEDLCLYLMNDIVETKRKVSGWNLLPRLFDVMDYDRSGSIDRTEIQQGLMKYCKDNAIEYKDEEVQRLFDEADDNDDMTLDLREFSVFMNSFSELVGMPIDDIATHMLSHLPLPLRMLEAFKKVFRIWIK